MKSRSREGAAQVSKSDARLLPSSGLLPSSNPRAEPRPQLFDLLADPHEDRNLAAANPDVVARLAARVQTWWDASPRQTQTTWPR
jgi:hypothetical protein